VTQDWAQECKNTVKAGGKCRQNTSRKQHLHAYWMQRTFLFKWKNIMCYQCLANHNGWKYV